ncbi:hypothetical protein [Algibacillus agarilyticus]|uniref:hypothetical protein n=1 Tax=Algibacillus agarilyticus TaxID=2234133 RepID=UPI000DCFD5CE|nr:hypothetical protein [Algibacillus agarilyticus]
MKNKITTGLIAAAVGSFMSPAFAYDHLLYNVAEQGIGAGEIYFVGQPSPYTTSEFRDLLADSGLELVQNSVLKPGQCTIMYSETDSANNTAGFGMLACSRELTEGVTLSVQAVYGECGGASNGAGGSCAVGVFSTELELDYGPVSQAFSVSVAEAEVCGSLSPEKLCMGAEANLVEATTSVTDPFGNELGVGVSVGVGAGANGSVEGGVISADIALGIGLGAEMSFSVDYATTGKAIFSAGKNGYLAATNSQGGRVIIGAGADFGEALRLSDSSMALYDMGKYVVAVDAFSSTRNTLVDAANISADGIQEVDSFFNNEVKDAVGNAINTVGNTANNIRKKLKKLF